MGNYKSASIERLLKAILLLKSEEECEKFLEDICTITEIQDMGQRLDVAIMLDKGMSYQRISEKTGISTATISRVGRCLNYGSGGYKDMIEKLKTEGLTDDV